MEERNEREEMLLVWCYFVAQFPLLHEAQQMSLRMKNVLEGILFIQPLVLSKELCCLLPPGLLALKVNLSWILSKYFIIYLPLNNGAK